MRNIIQTPQSSKYSHGVDERAREVFDWNKLLAKLDSFELPKAAISIYYGETTYSYNDKLFEEQMAAKLLLRSQLRERRRKCRMRWSKSLDQGQSPTASVSTFLQSSQDCIVATQILSSMDTQAIKPLQKGLIVTAPALSLTQILMHGSRFHRKKAPKEVWCGASKEVKDGIQALLFRGCTRVKEQWQKTELEKRILCEFFPELKEADTAAVTARVFKELEEANLIVRHHDGDWGQDSFTLTEETIMY